MEEFKINRKYIQFIQERVDFWKSCFNVLYDWNIEFVNDDKNYCKSMYNVGSKKMVIYPCDLEDFDSYILHEVLKMALIVGNISAENASSVLEDVCTLIKR